MSSLVAFLTSSGGNKQIVGIITIVVFFGGIIALSLWSTMTAAKKGAKKIRNKYGDRIIGEGVFSKSLHYFFTQDEFLAQKYNAVFAIYRLSDIRTIGVRWDSVQRLNVLFMMDADGNRIKPSEVIGGTKAARKMFGNNALSMNKDDMVELCKSILKYAPHVRLETKE